ncbi:MAG TPA: hypothetical protein VFS16_15055 [Acidimicrobiia bacterium]|nr:hypothetical protein [Acidimicrobiia bacterium]
MAGRLTDRSARAGIALTVAGGATLAGGWAGLDGSTLLTEQIPWIVSGGLGGLALLAVGLQFFSTAGFAAERRRLERVEAAILAGRDSPPAGAAGPGVPR